MKHNFLSFRAVMMAFLLMMGMTAFAQVAVQGTVTDVATGDPIIGASVLEIGTTNGTITDFDGNFSLMVQPGAKLSISYMGYKTQELEELIACAEDIIANPAKYAQACRGKKLATLFLSVTVSLRKTMLPVRLPPSSRMR